MAKDQSIPDGIKLVQEFVNTWELEHGPDALVEISSAAAWMQAQGFSPAGLTNADLSGLREMREAVRKALLANSGDADAEDAWRELSRVISGTPVAVQLNELDSVCLAAVTAGGGTPLRAAVAGAIYDGVRDGTWRRLKACKKASCLWAFYDQSKNGSGAWCSMATCGNRVKAQRRRQRSSSS